MCIYVTVPEITKHHPRSVIHNPNHNLGIPTPSPTPHPNHNSSFPLPVSAAVPEASLADSSTSPSIGDPSTSFGARRLAVTSMLMAFCLGLVFLGHATTAPSACWGWYRERSSRASFRQSR